MAAKVDRITLNVREFRELRKSPAVKAKLRRITGAIAAVAGEGYEARVRDGKTRARGSVVTVSFEAIMENARYNTLLRSLGNGRGK